MANDQLERDGQFFASAYDFLSEYDWIFRTSNTEFIARDILDQIPIAWTEFCKHLNNEDFNTMPDGLGHIKGIPTSFSLFFEKLKQLHSKRVHSAPKISSIDTNTRLLPKGINVKKYHEIQRLSSEIHAILDATGIPPSNWILIDVGCGLGYLSQLINRQFGGYRVLGIEGDPSRVQAARQRQAKYYPESLKSVFYAEHFVRECNTSAEFIEEQCQQLFGIDSINNSSIRYAIIGLHACAALTVTASQLFLHMNRARLLSIMPCCYHKMIEPDRTAAGHQVRRECIPLSRCMVANVTREKWSQVISIPFLRLACQQGASRWRVASAQEHCDHGAAMWERALLQAIVGEGEHIVASKCATRNSSEICSRWPLLKKYTLKNSNRNEDVPWEDKHLTAADSISSKHPNGPFLAELLTGLQATVQWLCEYVVLFDRVCYLKEQLGTTDQAVYLSQIFCDQLSPRCFLLVAHK